MRTNVYLLFYLKKPKNYESQKLPSIKIPVHSLDKKFEHFSTKLLFKFCLSAMVVVFFILLLINFLVFSSYDLENEELLAKVSQNTARASLLKEAIKTLDSLEKTEKAGFISSLNFNVKKGQRSQDEVRKLFLEVEFGVLKRGL